MPRWNAGVWWCGLHEDEVVAKLSRDRGKPLLWLNELKSTALQISLVDTRIKPHRECPNTPLPTKDNSWKWSANRGAVALTGAS